MSEPDPDPEPPKIKKYQKYVKVGKKEIPEGFCVTLLYNNNNYICSMSNIVWNKLWQKAKARNITENLIKVMLRIYYKNKVTIQF